MPGNTVDHPKYYENGPFECILLAEQYSFNVGNCLQYVWRHKDKGHPKEDLEKALWYAKQAIAREEAFAPPLRPALLQFITHRFHGTHRCKRL